MVCSTHSLVPICTPVVCHTHFRFYSVLIALEALDPVLVSSSAIVPCFVHARAHVLFMFVRSVLQIVNLK